MCEKACEGVRGLQIHNIMRHEGVDERRTSVETPQGPACLTRFDEQIDGLSYAKHLFRHRRCSECKTEWAVFTMANDEMGVTDAEVADGEKDVEFEEEEKEAQETHAAEEHVKPKKTRRGFFPRALLRPQGVGELTAVEARQWVTKLSQVIAKETDGEGGPRMVLTVIATADAVRSYLKTSSQKAAFMAYRCALVDAAV